MPDRHGVGEDGFVLKGFDEILADMQSRAQTLFGDDVDLTPGSPLRKVLDATAWQTHDLWKGLESQYYSNFVTTAEGPSLDLLGADVGLERRQLFATGTVTLTLAAGEPERRYVLPAGTIVQTAPGARFRTLNPATIIAGGPPGEVRAEALERGPGGNIPPAALTQLDPDHARFYLNLGTATVTPSNAAAFAGGELLEGDNAYRSRLRGYPRSLWTLERFVRAVRDIDGVRDCRAFDPLGCVDVSQSFFNIFLFGQRAFSLERRLAAPYFFDVVVATEPGWPWRTLGPTRGVYERIAEDTRELRPVSIFPNLVPANEVEVGMRGTLLVQAGHDRDAILAHIVGGLRDHVASLTLGNDVLHSDVIVLVRRTPGLLDIRDLHLRRCPPVFGRVNMSGAQFGQSVELGVGENIDLAPDEIPRFEIDSRLIDVAVIER